MAPSGLTMLKRVFDVLASTPEKLRREIEAMSPRELKIIPAPNKWSVQIVLAHFAFYPLMGNMRKFYTLS
jgi:hypothetical protein